MLALGPDRAKDALRAPRSGRAEGPVLDAIRAERTIAVKRLRGVGFTPGGHAGAAMSKSEELIAQLTSWPIAWVGVVLAVAIAVRLLRGFGPVAKQVAVQHFHPLTKVIDRVERAFGAFVETESAGAKVTYIGAYDLGPQYLAFWIFTTTDKERDRLLNEPQMIEALHELLRSNSYPVDAVASVGLAVESQETVDRDFEGNGFYAMK